MENENEYDDAAFTRASVEADSILGALWESGARLSDIEDTIANGIANAGGPDVHVSITEKT